MANGRDDEHDDEHPLHSTIRPDPDELREDDDDDDPFARNDDERHDGDESPRVSKRDRAVPRDLKDDGFRGTKRAVYLGVFALICLLIVGTLAGASLFHGSDSSPIASHAVAAPLGAPATPGPTPSSMFRVAVTQPMATPTPFVATTATPMSAPGQQSTQTQTPGQTPAFDPTLDAKRTMDAGARSSSKMALEAAHQIQESDPQTAAQLASFIAKTSGAPETNGGRVVSGGGAQADAMTRSASGQTQSAPSAAPSTAFVSTAHPPVDVATLRNDTHETFVDKEAKAAGDVGYQSTTTGTQLCFGTVVWVELYTDVNSDLPGALRGMVTRPVYDCATHSVVLVPPGAWVDGFYDSRVVFGESRVVAGFTTIEFPGGKLKYVMGSQTGTDPQGASGLPASVDAHSAKAYRSAFSLGILGALSSLLVPQQSAFQQPTITQQLLQQVGTQYVNATTSQVNQQIAQPPTLRLYHGYQFPILITRDLPMRPWVAQ